MPMKAEDRIALQDADDGDESDDVFVKRNATKLTHYHDDRDCRCLREPIETITRKAA